MKLVCKDKIIDLSKFDTVFISQGIITHHSFVIQAKRCYVGNPSSIPEEIARFEQENTAEALLKAISENWINNTDYFDVIEWEKLNMHN